MTRILLTCFALLLAVVTAGPLQATQEFQNAIHILHRELTSLSSTGPRFALAIPTTRVPRSKRSDDEDDDEIDAPPTRHARHRRRRRCRTRPSCSRGFGEKRQASARKSNVGKESQEAAVNATALLKIASSYDEDAANKTMLAEGGRPSASDSKDIEVYDEALGTDEIELEQISLPPWTDPSRKERNESADYAEDMLSPTIYAPVDDHATFQEGLTSLLTKLFQSLRNESLENSRNALKGLNLVDANVEDPCQRWLNSRDKFEEAFSGALATLPTCPCHYPSDIFYEDKIWDEKQRKHFRWRDVSGESQRLDVYKPGAAYCVRSLLAQGSDSAAAQHCCYDRKRKLLTRGSGAGTPNFVSPEISPILHERIDVLPWRLCKGDFSRYNRVRPPNNENACEANPDEEEYQRQIDDTKYY